MTVGLACPGRATTPEALAARARVPLDAARLVFAMAEGDSDCLAIIRGPSMDQVSVEQRSAVIWVAREYTALSYPEIGRALNRDHASVLRLHRRAKARFADDAEFRAMCAALARSVTGLCNAEPVAGVGS